MSYLLIGSFTSPFVRKIRLACHGRVAYDLQTVNYLEKQGDEYLKAMNPINKLPILIDGDQKIFESRVIYNYLSQKHGWRPLSLEDENRISAMEAVADTTVSLFQLKRGGLDLTLDNWYIKRQWERIPNILHYLSPWVKTLDPQKDQDWAYPSMNLFSFLYWAQFRQMLSLQEFPEFQDFLKAFKDKPGVRETDIPPA